MFEQMKDLANQLDSLVDNFHPDELIWREKQERIVKRVRELVIDEKVYLVGTHRYSFRGGEPARIVELVFLPHGKEKRVCYVIKFSDSVEDTRAVKDHQYFEIVSEQDVLNNKIPPVIH